MEVVMRRGWVIWLIVASACASSTDAQQQGDFVVVPPCPNCAGSGASAGSTGVAPMSMGAGIGTAPVTPPSGTAGIGSAPMPPGSAGAPSPAGGAAAPVAGTSATGTAGSAAGTAGATAPPVVVGPDQMLPPVSDYTAPGPFNPTMEVGNTGPGGAYTMFRPSNLDQNGFKFVPATWGNGITTTPQYYPWLATVASHGFVIIAANTTTVSAAAMTMGLDWLIEQNAAGELQGKLDTNRAVCLGYSLGGQGAVGCGSHAKVVTTIAMHPAGGFGASLHGPLLLFSGANDTVCTPAAFVQPIFDGSTVPTFYGFLSDADHLEPVLTGGRELAPTIAWLRLWVFGDQGAKPFFYGTDCKLCSAPWEMPQSKMLP
jgi:hypothetical protein